jgi:hypothetical protein
VSQVVGPAIAAHAVGQPSAGIMPLSFGFAEDGAPGLVTQAGLEYAVFGHRGGGVPPCGPGLGVGRNTAGATFMLHRYYPIFRAKVDLGAPGGGVGKP